MVFGKYIDREKLRGAFGYGKTKKLAKLLGIHRTSLSRKLAHPMTIEDLNEICFYLGRDTNDFLVDRQMTQEEMDKKRRQREDLSKSRRLGVTPTPTKPKNIAD